MPEVAEYRPANQPEIVIRLEARDAHLLDLCRWQARRKPRSLTVYVQGWTGGRQVYPHRMIMGAPADMEVNHIDGDGLNNARSNLEVVTHRENMRHATAVLGRGWGPRVEIVEDKARKRLADGRVKTYVYDRRTKALLRSSIGGSDTDGAN